MIFPRLDDRRSIPKRSAACFVRPTYPPHSSKWGSHNRPLRADHTGANYVLFHMVIFDLSVYWLAHTSWQARIFDYVINGYCKNRAGVRFIERGDYEVMKAENGQIIGRSDFAAAVEEGVVLEMIIVLRQKAAFQKRKEMCPRCGHEAFYTMPHGSWSEWKVLIILLHYMPIANIVGHSYHCSGQFQVAVAFQVDDKEYEENNERVDAKIISPAS